MKIKLRLAGTELAFEVQRRGPAIHVDRDGVTTELRLVEQDGPFFILEFTDDHGRHHLIRAAGLVEGDRRQLWVDGQTLRYERIRGQREDRAPAGKEASLSPAIPALVSQILVEPGAVVAPGDRLILLESMKMVIPIQSPCAGTVTRINCAVGDAVQPGQQLVEIEEEEKD